MKMMMISVHSSGQPSRKMITWARIRNCSGVSSRPVHEVRDHRLAAEVGEDRGEGERADEEPAHHRRGAHGEVDRLAQPLPGERAVGGGEQEPAERADRGRLGRRGEAEEDRAEHRQDQERERQERGEQATRRRSRPRCRRGPPRAASARSDRVEHGADRPRRRCRARRAGSPGGRRRRRAARTDTPEVAP